MEKRNHCDVYSYGRLITPPLSEGIVKFRQTYRRGYFIRQLSIYLVLLLILKKTKAFFMDESSEVLIYPKILTKVPIKRLGNFQKLLW